MKEELENIRSETINGAVLRSKVQSFEEGETPTKYFSGLKKRNYINKRINNINTSKTTVRNTSGILKELKAYYEQLYTSNIKDHDSEEYDNNLRLFLNDNNIKKLNEQQRISCEGIITELEIKNAIKEKKPGKSPGIDGIPIEFYKFFWADLGNFLIRSIQEVFQEGEILPTQKRGVITLIPKGDKPREYLKNWRPISLLNSDYKIITSVMANSMKQVLCDVIGTNQKERFSYR